MPRILIVEDKLVEARDLQEVLIELGHDVPSLATSAEQALLLASEQRPDLVLIDVHLGGRHDGIATAALLREHFGVPIVYVTAFADPATVKRASSTEPYGYLLMPFDTRDLHTTVEIALYRREMERMAREREEWLQAVLRSMGEAVVSVGR